VQTALLAGAFGQGNLGDDALVDSFRHALPSWRVVATAEDAPSPSRHDSDVVASRRRGLIVRQMLSSDAVVMGGGTLFKTLHPSTQRRPLGLLANAAVLALGASLSQRRIAMVGVGAGQLDGPGAIRLSRVLVRCADLLVLRDEESAYELAQAGVPGPFRVGADPAWTLLRAPESARPPGPSKVLVVPSHLATGSGTYEHMVDRLISTVDCLSNLGVEVHMQPWQVSTAWRQDDTAIVDRVVAGAAHRVRPLPVPSSLVDAVATMGTHGAVLAFRFHALVAAGAAGVPSVAVAHEPKMSGLTRRLGQRMVATEFDPEHLATEVLAALASPGPAPALVKSEIDRAEESFRLLRVLLSQGASEEAESMGALPLVP